jgi:hypothetical protein
MGGGTGNWRSCTVCAGVGACSRSAGEGKRTRGLMGKAEGKSPLGRPRRRWEDIANVDIKVIGCGDVHWVDLLQNRGDR